MSRIAALLLTVGLGATAGVAATSAAPQNRFEARAARQLDQALRDRTPGPAQTCLGGTTRLRDQSRTFITARDKATVVFGRGGTVWRTDLRDCVGMRDGMSLVTVTPTASLCRGDIAQVVDLRIPSGAGGGCVWGDFVPYVPDGSGSAR